MHNVVSVQGYSLHQNFGQHNFHLSIAHPHPNSYFITPNPILLYYMICQIDIYIFFLPTK